MVHKIVTGAVCALFAAALLAGCAGDTGSTASGSSSQVLGQITAITETSITLNLAESNGEEGQRPGTDAKSSPEGAPPQTEDMPQGEPPASGESRPEILQGDPADEDGQPAQRGGEAFGEPTLTGESQTIILTSSTKYTLAGSTAVYSDFEQGDWVRVEIKDLVAVAVTGLEMPAQPGESPAPGENAPDENSADAGTPAVGAPAQEPLDGQQKTEPAAGSEASGSANALATISL